MKEEDLIVHLRRFLKSLLTATDPEVRKRIKKNIMAFTELLCNHQYYNQN